MAAWSLLTLAEFCSGMSELRWPYLAARDCARGLRDRDFRVADNQFWPEFIGKVLKESQFATLAYKASW